MTLTAEKNVKRNNLVEPESQEASETQWKWIEDTLQSSTAHYLIVGGHFPVWSVAEHGPTDCLVNRLRPLLQKYKVTAYISGHDHNLQVTLLVFSILLKYFLVFKCQPSTFFI